MVQIYREDFNPDRGTVTYGFGWKSDGPPTLSHYDVEIPLFNTRLVSPNLPNWKWLMENGNDASTGLTGLRYRRKYSSGQLYYQLPSGADIFEEFITGFLSRGNGAGSFDPAGVAVVNQARTKSQVQFAKNFNKATQNWNSGQFLGELLQTARQLASPARALRNGVDELFKSMKRIHRGQNTNVPRVARSLARAVSDTWLEWQFGVKPLVNDADAAAEAFRAMASGRCFDIVRITGKGEAEARVPLYSGFTSWTAPIGPTPTVKQDRQCYDTCEVITRGAWKNQNPGGEMPVPGRFGVGIKDIIPTAWELVPWSFFVDYFTNIGDVLEAWSMRFVDFSWLNQTTRSCRTVQLSDIIVPHGQPLPWIGHGGSAILKRYDVQRNTISNKFDSHFSIEIPGFGDSPKKWLNIAALAAMGIRPK